jgi:hypothetical protein
MVEDVEAMQVTNDECAIQACGSADSMLQETNGGRGLLHGLLPMAASLRIPSKRTSSDSKSASSRSADKAKAHKVRADMIRRVDIPVRINQMSVGGVLRDAPVGSAGVVSEKPDKLSYDEETPQGGEYEEDVVHDSRVEEEPLPTVPEENLHSRRRNSWNVGPRDKPEGAHRVSRTHTHGLHSLTLSLAL